MGIAEHRNPIRPQFGGKGGGPPHAGFVLAWKPIDEIEIHACDARPPQARHTLSDLIKGLDAINLGLDNRVKGLHAKAGAVHARAGQSGEKVPVQAARIELDRNLGIGLYPKRSAQMADQGLKIIGRERVWTAAAEMQVGGAGGLAKRRRPKLDFLVQRFEIAGDPSIAIGHRGVAAAIPTELVAKRDVDIEGERSLCGFSPASRFSLAHMVVKRHGGGVAGIAGQIALGILKEGGGNGRTGHGAVESPLRAKHVEGRSSAATAASALRRLNSWL